MTIRPFTQHTFHDYLAHHRLMASRCQDCGELHLPPRPLCPNCHGQNMGWAELSGQGRLRAFTAIHIAPTAMIDAGYGRENPYLAGIVETAEGPSISAQILGLDPSRPSLAAIGDPVRVAFLERGEGDGRQTVLAFEVVRGLLDDQGRAAEP